MEYASNAVKAPKKSRFVGYDLRFQNVRSMNPIAPKSETYIIHTFDCIHALYDVERYETELTAIVANI